MNKKRFVYHEEYFPLNVREIIDNETGKTYDCEDVTDLLNQLNDEKELLEKGKMEALSLLGEEIDKNEQLKKQSKRYEDGLWVRFTKLEKENEQLAEENEQLKAKVKRLQDIATRTEEEKEHYADLYNECCKHKLSDEAIKQAYADLNRREREKHSQGNATYTAKINRNEVIY